MTTETLIATSPTTHASIGKTGVLIVNLGTPDSPNTPDVRKYLREFLMDGRVIDIPFIPRWMLVNLIIAPFRAPKSAKIYKELWTEDGSPLKTYGYSVEKMLQQMGLSSLTVIPFFPQYASATTGSVYEEVMRILKGWQIMPELRFVNRFLDHPKFIEGFARPAKKYMAEHKFDHFLFSYHGIPERQIRKGDPTKAQCKLGSCCDTLNQHNQFCYRAQCFETTRLLVKALGLTEGSYTTCFQSRLGSDPWIKPYSDDVIKNLAKSGVKSVLAFSPAFVSDCLETTIEVGDEYRELFEENGGEHWQLVESLNDSQLWVEVLADLVEKN